MGWARENHTDFIGRCIQMRVKWKKLDAVELVALCYSMLIDDLITIETSRVEAKETIDKRLSNITQAEKIKRGIKPEAEPFVISKEMMAKMGINIQPKQESP